MKRIIALCAALLWLGGANAIAANTAQVGLSEGAYTDLGAAPVSVQALNGNAWVVVADSTPSLAAGGVLLTPMGPNVPITFQQADASSHVYALATSGPATVAYTAIYAASLGSSVSVTNFPATQPVGAAPGAFADGALVTEGTTTDAACALPASTTACSVEALLKAIGNIARTINSTLGSPFQAGGTVTPTNSSGAPLYVAGFDSGSAPAIGAGATQTPANSSHTAGKVVGGLFTIPVARIAGGSGAVSRFFGYSVAGDTTGLLWRIWDKSPGATTCTDNANFVGSATDDLHLIAQPFSATPAAAAQTQGDAKTYFENDFVPPASYKNQDTSPSVNIYACAVATATFTPGVGAYSVDATGYQN